ncbi:NADP-dependent oxidoreductase [Granulicella mallensis]|uniref:NADPH:quinone reductase n=1 Tax=Granulicella mallensis (strain ATCC BAA-1857 / DSM 23137 / MP5ACTX8) TaxID=682795 RepID=G8NZP0_GRAMM|nr:NADP-dependent oxidoreductase [Granulicella mallensis]AEU39160.1 NADPH:quinone reductase [Granulicella mallensis MP5ACTX8]
MKAVVLHEYGGPSKLKYEDFPDPQAGKGEVLVRVAAAGLNPIDWKIRSGAMKEFMPVQFPTVLGYDFAGVVRELGEGVTGFAVGDRVFGRTGACYAELCVVKAEELAKVPEGVETTTAGALSVVATTADQLIRTAAKLQAGQTVLLTGALGSVGRMALFCALELGAKVIAGVRKKQIEEALALGATAAIDVSDKDELAKLGMVDAVADTIGGALAEKLIAKVKPGGAFGSIVGPVGNAALHPTVEVNAFGSHADAKVIVHYAEAIRDGKLALPIDRMLPLSDASEAHAAAEKGGVGKIVLLA